MRVSLKVRERLPRIVMEGVSFPSLKSVSLSIFAKGSLGFGSLGVPSTRAHFPMVLSHPTMLFNTQQWSYRGRRFEIFKHSSVENNTIKKFQVSCVREYNKNSENGQIRLQTSD